ncbi:MAG: hypothetical protein ACR2K5_11100 [Pseudolabrys sp.]
MPIISYFLVIGPILFGLLLWSGDTLHPSPLPFQTSQQVGLPAPYKAEPEPDVAPSALHSSPVKNAAVEQQPMEKASASKAASGHKRKLARTHRKAKRFPDTAYGYAIESRLQAPSFSFER